MTELRLENSAQLHTCIKVFNRLVMKFISENADNDLYIAMGASRFEGIIEGRMVERMERSNSLSLSEVNEIIYEMQKRTRVNMSASTEQKLKSFLGYASQYVEQAFDIAVNDKPMPPALPGVEGTPRKF